jgi:hypothetical protein
MHAKSSYVKDRIAANNATLSAGRSDAYLGRTFAIQLFLGRFQFQLGFFLWSLNRDLASFLLRARSTRKDQNEH